MDLYMTTSYAKSLSKAVPLLSLTSWRANSTVQNDPTHMMRSLELKIQGFGTYLQHGKHSYRAPKYAS
jgi:predicted nuclease of restriction endonuclease-like RecB superfamily